MEYFPSCSRVSDVIICNNCGSRNIIKNVPTKTGKQQHFCKSCGSRFIRIYTYKAYHNDINEQIIRLTKEGIGIRGTARIPDISATTLLKRILLIARSIPLSTIPKGKTYEVDELRSFVKRKDNTIWVVCALERTTKAVISFCVGSRTKKTLNVVLKTLSLSGAKRIYTDGLKHYRYIIGPTIHSVSRYGTNHIERKNLSLRTHLKMLNRRTICFSRSAALLYACLKIYFFS